MDSDCGCEIISRKNEDQIEINPDGVGEEIFYTNDLFEKVKKFYENPIEDEKDDFLLENLEPKYDIKAFVNFLESLNKEEIDLPKEDNYPDEEKEAIDNTKIYSEKVEYKIKYIKKYLENLKDGS